MEESITWLECIRCQTDKCRHISLDLPDYICTRTPGQRTWQKTQQRHVYETLADANRAHWAHEKSVGKPCKIVEHVGGYVIVPVT
jgi:hypothetical protein